MGRGLVARRGEDGVMLLPAPCRQLGLDALGADRSAAVGQRHVVHQVPAQPGVVLIVQRQREGLWAADGLALAVGQRDGLATAG